MLKQFLLAGVVMLPIAANAAGITVTGSFYRDDGTLTTYVNITGDIGPSDDRRFNRTTANISGNVLVVLNSNGGNIIEGIAIGEKIFEKRWNTIVVARCVSACSLIWIAGAKRWAPERAGRLGFHASKSGGQELGAGNALIGAYLSKLGFGSAAIYYLMRAGPDEMEWLDGTKARRYGIDIDTLTDTWTPYLGN